MAVEKRDAVSIQISIDAGADVNASAAILFGCTALEAAVWNNDIVMVDYLLAIGADPDERSLVAAVSRSVELMPILLAARLRHYQRYPKGYGCGALQVAIGEKNVAMVETLLANGVTRHKHDRSPEAWQRGSDFRKRGSNHSVRRVCFWNCNQDRQKQ